MTQSNNPEDDREEPPPTDDGPAGISTEGGYVLYDTENEAAWIQSDTALDPAEVA